MTIYVVIPVNMDVAQIQSNLNNPLMMIAKKLVKIQNSDAVKIISHTRAQKQIPVVI